MNGPDRRRRAGRRPSRLGAPNQVHAAMPPLRRAPQGDGDRIERGRIHWILLSRQRAYFAVLFSAETPRRIPMAMSVGVLDHYNVSTRKLKETVQFYEDVLG